MDFWGVEGIFAGGGNEQIFLAGGEDLGMLTGISKQASRQVKIYF